MAFTLTLSGVLGGTTYTVNFLDKTLNPGFELVEEGFDIGPADRQDYWEGVTAATPKGIELIETQYVNREVTIRFNLYGNSRNDLATGARNIKRIITVARERQRVKVGERAQLAWQLDGMTNTMYFEILNGEVDIPRGIMSALTHERDGTRYIIRDCVLTLQTAPFMYQIAPRAGSPVSAVAATTLDNTPGGTYNNFVTLSGLSGDSPSPLIIQMTNSTFGSIHRQYLCLSRGDSFQSPDRWLTTGTFSGTIPAAGEEELTQASAGTLTTENGNFRLFGVCQAANTWDSTLYFQVRLSDAVSSEVFTYGPWVKGSGRALLDFGTFHLPPWKADLAGYIEYDADDYLIEVFVRGEVSQSYSVTMDSIQYAQVDGGFRVLTYRNPYFPVSSVVIDNAWTEQIWRDNGTVQSRNVIPFMLPLFAQPGETQYLAFYSEEATAFPLTGSEISVVVTYVPSYEVLG